MYYNYGGMYNAPPYLNNAPNASMDYWTRSLFQRLTALIDFKGLPEKAPRQYGWDKDAFKYAHVWRLFFFLFCSLTLIKLGL